MYRQMVAAEIKRLRNGSMVTVKQKRPTTRRATSGAIVEQTDVVTAQYRKQGGWLISAPWGKSRREIAMWDPTMEYWADDADFRGRR